MMPMTIHTLIFSFPDNMTQQDQDEFFSEIAPVMLASGAEKFEHRPHQGLPADEHAPVFIASAIAQIQYPDLDTIAAAFRDPALGEFMGKWQGRFPYKVVWANHEPVL
jgi:hypothetical protein